MIPGAVELMRRNDTVQKAHFADVCAFLGARDVLNFYFGRDTSDYGKQVSVSRYYAMVSHQLRGPIFAPKPGSPNRRFPSEPTSQFLLENAKCAFQITKSQQVVYIMRRKFIGGGPPLAAVANLRN